MTFTHNPSALVTPIKRDFGAIHHLDDFTGEITQEQDKNHPFRVSIRCGGAVVISQQVKTRAEAERILERHLKVLRMLKDGVFD